MSGDLPAGGTPGHGPAGGSRTLTANRTSGEGAGNSTGQAPGRGPSEDEAMIGISPFVSVRTLVAALRRRWHLWVALAVLGLVLGLAFSFLLPPPYTATATILLQHPAGTDAERAMPTDLQLLKTRTVAQGAIEQAHLDLTASELVTQYDGAILSDRVLTVTVKATTPQEAIRRGNAVAASFLAFRRRQFQQQLDAAVGAVQDRENALAADLAALDQQINDFSAGPQKDAAAVRAFGDVLTHRAEVADQIATLQRQIDANRADTLAVITGTSVVDPAAEDKRSPMKLAVEYALAGLVFGLVVGVGGIVAQEVISEAARTRADVATALDAPVAVSVGSIRKPRLMPARRSSRPKNSRDGGADPPGVGVIIRHLDRMLGHANDHPPALLVVSVGCDWPAALTASGLARELAGAGQNVLVVDYLRSTAVGERATLAPKAGQGTIRVIAGGADASAGTGDAAAVVVLATLEPELGAFHLRAWASSAVVMVAVGRATPTALHAAGQMLRSAGIDVTPAVLVGADRADETLGVPGGRLGGPPPPPPASAATNGASAPASETVAPGTAS